MKSKTCLNCGTELSGYFCSNCGQSSEVRPITILNSTRDVVRETFDIEGPIMRTIYGSITDPGRLALNYVRGARKSYANPIKYFIVAYGFLILVMQVLRWMGYVELDVYSESLPFDDSRKNRLQELSLQNGLFMQGALLPVQAYLLRLFFLNSERTWAEFIVLLTYCFGTIGIVFALFSLTALFEQGYVQSFLAYFTVITVLYLGWAVVRFTESKSVVGGFRFGFASILYFGGIQPLILYLISYL